MSCNCQEKRPNLNTWGCGCNKMPEEPRRKGVVKFCDICDPCNPAATNVKICAFVVPTLEEGRYFKNSFIFVQEDDSVYFISDDRSEIPFGSRPRFEDNFDPTDSDNKFKNTVIYDIPGQAAYVYGPDGTYLNIPLVTTPVSDIQAGEGIIVTAEGGVYTIAVDDTIAKQEDLHSVTLLVTNHTSQINNLSGRMDDAEDDISSMSTELTETHGIATSASEQATLARTEAGAAQQTATEALSAVSTQFALLSAQIEALDVRVTALENQ